MSDELTVSELSSLSYYKNDLAAMDTAAINEEINEVSNRVDEESSWLEALCAHKKQRKLQKAAEDRKKTYKLTLDALWEQTAMEFVETLDYDFQKMFRRNRKELEKLGRHILNERQRKYKEGLCDGKF